MSRKRRPAPRAAEAGYILVGAVILVFVMTIIALAFLSLAGGETRAAQQHLDSQKAFWLAEAGKDRAIRNLSERTTPPTSDERIFDAVPGPDGGSYTVDCLVDTTAAWQAEKAFVLDCVGTRGDLQRRIRQRIRMVSFAQYAYFTDDELSATGSQIWFYSGDVIEGLLHSNGVIRISGTPRFRGEVTSADDHMLGYQNYWVDEPSDWPVGGNNPVFERGFELDSPTIELPMQTLDLRAQAQTGGIFVPAAAEIELGITGATGVGTYAPGWLRYRNVGGTNWISARIGGLTNRVVYSDGDVHVKGELDGELTIASRQNVRIEDDIRYHESDALGTPLAGCNDLLGLVAERNVIFVDNLANRTDLIVDAVLMALGTSITAENYSSGSPRGILTIWGGLIQRRRGAVGTFYGSSGIATGYSKNYHYDPRVTGRRPPAFPLTGTYEELVWMETWDETSPF